MFTKVIKNTELQGTVIITVGSIIGSFFAYLLQFFLGRMLSVENYGTFSAFISISTIIGVPGGVFIVALIKIVSELLAKSDFKKITALFWKVSIWGFFYGCIIFFCTLLLKDFIAHNLNLSNTSPIIFFGWFLGVSFFPNISRSYLQALLRYKALAFFTIFSGFLRFIFPVILVYLHYGLSGVFIGMGVGLILSYLSSILLLKKNFRFYEKEDLSTQYKKFINLGIPVAFMNFGLMALNNIDMILVKKFFDPNMAGYYAGTVTLGKILLFGAGSVTIIMFPQISAAFASGVDYVKKFKRLYLLQALIVIVGVASFIIFPQLLTVAFFGDRFINSVKYLPRFSIFVGLYVLVNFMVMFFLAIDKRNVFLVLLPAAIIQYVLISLFHSDLNQIININIGIILSTYLILLLYFKKTVPTALMKYNTK